MSLPFRAVIFDLDGTLLDTLNDIAGAANAALATLGRPTHTPARYCDLVGEGVLLLMRRALGAAGTDEALVAQAVDAFFDAYTRADHPNTRPYDGVPELLEELQDRSTPMAVLSNKPHALAASLVSRELDRWAFGPVLGSRADLPRKPDPSGALRIAAQWGIDPGEIAFVGDSAIDIVTARSAGMIPIGVLWGFRDAAELAGAGPDRLIGAPVQLLDG